MIRTILMDVEGTTTSIRFVHETLFPFSFEKMAAFFETHQSDPLVQKAILEVGQGNLQKAVEQLQQWIREDKKEPTLKAIQGLIWQEGYESGSLQGHVYDDVPRAFEAWKQQGLEMAIYSSGSVLAQKLIFGFSSAGNLNPYLRAYFDTSVGGKREASSYRTIAKELGRSANEILFLSDVAEELLAAREAGFQITQIVRSGTTPNETVPQAANLLAVTT